MAYFEAIGLLMLLSMAALAILPFYRVRRYLGVLLSATALGGFVIGYGFGSRDAINKLAPFLNRETAGDAMVVVEPYVGSPLWGVGIGLFLILLAVLVFRGDIRAYRNERGGRSHLDSDPTELS